MPKISQRGKRTPASPIRKLVPYSDQAKAAGKKVYHLNIGQPDIPTPTVVMDAIRNINEEVIAYTQSAGVPAYRQQWADYYTQKLGLKGITSANIQVSTGGSEALLFGLMSCLDAGDEVIVPEPCYANYNGFASAGDIVLKPITAYIDSDFALPPMEDFEKLITPQTKAILICNPSNPTGYLYSKKELEVLKDIALKYDLYLFADEVYRDFVYDGLEHTSILSLDGLENNAIVVDSISKRYSACGARIGVLVSRNKEVMATALKFAQARLSPPALGQLAGAAAFHAPESYITNVIAEYQNRRDILVEGLRNIEGIVCPSPKGAFYVTAQLPVADSEDFCRWMLVDFEHNGETVMIAPANGFYVSDLGRQEVRIAYVLNEKDLKTAITCIEKGLKQYQVLKASESLEVKEVG